MHIIIINSTTNGKSLKICGYTIYSYMIYIYIYHYIPLQISDIPMICPSDLHNPMASPIASPSYRATPPRDGPNALDPVDRLPIRAGCNTRKGKKRAIRCCKLFPSQNWITLGYHLWLIPISEIHQHLEIIWNHMYIYIYIMPIKMGNIGIADVNLQWVRP